MKVAKFTIITLGALLFSTNTFAFKNKNINDFKTLSKFKTVKEFDTYYNRYTQKCLDNGFGGTGSIPCYVGYKLWDRELNIYYKKLSSKLNNQDKKTLKNSQRQWLKSRDLDMVFNSKVMDKIYTEEGTMYQLIRSGHAHDLALEIIKERALTLKRWYQTIK